MCSFSDMVLKLSFFHGLVALVLACRCILRENYTTFGRMIKRDSIKYIWEQRVFMDCIKN